MFLPKKSPKVREESSEELVVSSTLTVVMVLWVYTDVQTHQVAHVKYVVCCISIIQLILYTNYTVKNCFFSFFFFIKSSKFRKGKMNFLGNLKALLLLSVPCERVTFSLSQHKSLNLFFRELFP